MKINTTILKKVLSPVFDTRAAGVYILLFATVIGIATFIENDYGTSAAQKIVYRAWWFELLLLLFGGSIIVNIIKYRMIPQKKWALLTFHLSIILILLGAAVTRYYGYEGMMHIRENATSDTFLSSETHLTFDIIHEGQLYRVDEPVLFASLGNNKWQESYKIGNKLIEAKVHQFIPNPVQTLESDPDGVPTLQIIIAGSGGRQEYFLSHGEKKRLQNVNFNFTNTFIPGAVNIVHRNDSILIAADSPMTQMTMATQQLDTLDPMHGYYPLMVRSLYTHESGRFVFSDYKPSASTKLSSESAKVKNESMMALLMEILVDGKSQYTYVYGRKGVQGQPASLSFDNTQVNTSFGAKPIQLPFALKLYKFILEKYPGTNSAASYASEVQLIDPAKNLQEDHRIYMNHILDYGGYRFFQSSFDKDEKGTYLSVNHDFWGTWISYIGYILLTLGLILVLFSKRSRFYQVSQKLKQMREKTNLGVAIIILLLTSMTIHTQAQAPNRVIDPDHAKLFSELVVQDHKGRMKPMHTLTREVMRKVARKESMLGLNADQIVLGMLANGKDWNDVPFIKLGKHTDLQKKLGVADVFVSYEDFFNGNGQYVLRDEVRRAYGLQPIDRGMYEKEMMKADERLNIVSMVFSGDMFKLIPIQGDPNNSWASSRVLNPVHGTEGASYDYSVADKFFSAYPEALQASMQSGDYSLPNQMLAELSEYQEKVGNAVIPSDTRINAEILLNNLNVFNRLAVTYALLGLAFLILLFVTVFKHDLKFKRLYQVLFSIALLAFVLHTVGLGLRWYVSGRAPWSNGYESMIYIAWTTCLGGMIFTRKSLGGMAATMILAATILLVAMLSYLDPEITPLVPVLRSYWLTIHVSLEAGSYGFLMLGAIIGLINLVLMIFLTDRNKERIKMLVKEMSYISELTLIGGLIMISVGTYLGGVWANESWGRYWGWDAKETWALVTILIYAFILHMRLIPKMQGLFAYNFASLFGWASVIMTYYGVNYYLSGLHSYAAGDPAPLPSWVGIAVISLIAISILAYWKKRKFAVF